ncbi:nucleobase:cation symporter-2 family protein [Bacillus sp. Marseille-P3661]|uniref:nucleobase:cation symporter-2 family protein n=1 Tax=Bacillus sp. Marseille-P3661 TaxID=1936234 RepID=UPI000C821D44|nr:nucleobase:cation symporter-2 family protein [Bacillus sp. Marseille-P3661]
MQNSIKTFALGFQHVLAMYAGAIIVPLIVGGALGLTIEQLTYIIGIDILTCGVASLLQVWKNKYFGIGLPVMLGCTFTAVGPMIAIGSQYGIQSVYGAIIASGIIVVLIAKYFGKLIKFFPPVVIGSVVTIIGITLIPTAMNSMGGGQGNPEFGAPKFLMLSFGVLILILLLNKFTTGFLRSVSILIGMVVGTIAAYFMGIVDFTNVGEAKWIHMVQPFYFGAPKFEITPILTMTLVAIVGLIESTGTYLALSNICDRKLTDKDITNGYRAEGLAITLGGIFNAFPYTTYSQNVGLVQLSGVKSKSVIVMAGFILITLGFVPKIAAVTTIIPDPVLGGAMVAMFGMVVAYGIKMLSNVSFETNGNLLIIACSVGMGLGVTTVPELFAQFPSSIQIITSNGIVAGSITAIVLNILFNVIPSRQEKKAANTSTQLKEQQAS